MEEPEIKKLSQGRACTPQESDNNDGGMCFCARAVITIIIALVTTFILFTLLSTYPSGALPAAQISNYTTTCNTSEEFQNNLYKLTVKVHNLLEKQKLKHFLCYDSLWGALENRGVLPWVTQVEICMEKENLAKKSMKFWINDFGVAKLTLHYCWKQGAYIITDPHFKEGSVLLILFKMEPKTHNLMRSGWNYYRWDPDCRESSLHCFHPYLIDAPPLRKKLFGEIKMPVPHFNEAIQRYLFPDTWQLGSRGSMPKNC